MRLFQKYFLLFIMCALLAACGSGDSQPSLATLRVAKAASPQILTIDQQYDIVRLVQGMFNAAPGNMYFQEFSNYIAGGGTMADLAVLLEQTKEFRSPQLYPAALSPQQFADKFITNFVGDAVNTANRAWLSDLIVFYLNNGYSRGGVIWELISALKNVPSTDPGWGKAAAQFANKVETAYYYSVTLAQSSGDLGTLQSVTRYVTDDYATVIAAKGMKPANLAPSWASLGITSGSRQVTLSWTPQQATTGATYTIYWSKTPGVTKKTGTRIVNVTSPYTHTGLINGTTYYYVVTQTVAGMEGAESLEVAAAPRGAIPAAPTGITVVPLNAAVQIKIDRTGVASTTKFNLYWSRTADLQSPVKITNAFGTGITFQHSALTNGAIYYYAVSAEGPEGESSLSKTVAATPMATSSAVNYRANYSEAQIAAPTAVTATAASQMVTLTWNMPTSQIPTVYSQDTTPTATPVISSYNVYWSNTLITDTTTAEKITLPVSATLRPPITFTHNTGLTNNLSYYYVVTAVAETDSSGNALYTVDGRQLYFESPLSSQVMVVPEGKAPLAPTGLAATSGSQQITLNWTTGSGTSTTAVYRIYASATAPATPDDLVTPENLVAIATAPPYLYTGLQYGATYYFVVTLLTDSESPPSNVVAVTLR